MNVDEQLLTADFFEQLKQQDERFRDLDLRLKIEKELRESLALKLVFEAAGEQAAVALEGLADVDPTDTKKITFLQAKVQRARFIAKTINSVINRGELAEQSINEEQAVQLEMEIETNNDNRA